MEQTQKKGVLAILTILPALIAAAAIFLLWRLPVASYQFKRKNYILRGRSLLKGTSIGGGTVEIPPYAVLILFVIAMAVVIVFSLLRGRMKETVRAEISAVAALVGFISAVVSASNGMNTVLSEMKKVTAGYGLIVIAIMSLVLVFFGL